MLTCIICRFETGLDEIVATTTPGHGICRTCDDRESGRSRRQRRPARRRLDDLLAA
jgi:hypothetical protein